MTITEVRNDKKQYLPLLLLADKQEDMIDRYLGRGTMYVLDYGVVKAECVVTDEAAKRRAIECLAKKYSPDDSEANRAAVIDREWDTLCVLELHIEHLSGKEAMALAKARRGE